MITVDPLNLTDNFILALEAEGLNYYDLDGVLTSNDEAAFQLFHDAYDPIEDYKEIKVQAIKAEAVTRAGQVLPFITNFDTMEFTRELWLSLVGGAKAPTASFQSLINIGSAGVNAVQAINAETDLQTVIDYDAINTPAWP